MNRKDVLNLLADCPIFDLTEDTFAEQILAYLPQNFEYEYNNGASKLVLLPKNANFVIKIPFNGYYDENCYWENKEYHWENIFIPHENACLDDNYCWDYCAAEALLYRKAKKAHVETAFCKTVYIGKVNDHPIYIQQKAQPFNKCAPNQQYHHPEYYQKIETTNKNIGIASWNRVWQTDAFEYYGEKKYNKIMQFIIDNDIEDLRDDNIGYIGASPVIFDYSSWHDGH